jgi:SAM-dependent methyltransferase
MSPDVPTANQYQLDEWNGDEGLHWVAYADAYDRQSEPFTRHLLDAAALPGSGEVLDVGCGCGAVTIAAARRARRALGVDLSAPMLDVARQRAREAAVSNVEFMRADAQLHRFETTRFDAVISRFGVMFFTDPVAAFANLRGALREHGQLAFVAWRSLLENEWLTVPAGAAFSVVPMPDLGPPGAPGPFAFENAARVQDILQAAGFVSVEVRPVDERILLGGATNLDETMEFLRGSGMARTVFQGVNQSDRDRALDAVRAALAPYETAAGIELGAAAWLATARSTG